MFSFYILFTNFFPRVFLLENAVAGPSTSSSAAPLTAQSIQFHFGGDAEEQSDEEGEEEEGEGDETMGGDREDDLETAFLMLDSARAIYEKIDTEEAKGKLAEIHRMLGDVASESGMSILSSLSYFASFILQGVYRVQNAD